MEHRAPYFIVDDVVATANFYREKMGFRYERFWGEPPCFCMVKRGGIIIMLSQLAKTGVTRPNRVADPNGLKPPSSSTCAVIRWPRRTLSHHFNPEVRGSRRS